jgi:antitoxin component YwqK of YwqJK toxin-antitoxin module
MPGTVKWLIGLLTPVALLLCVLCFGSPQWGKYVFVWQVYWFPDLLAEEYRREFDGSLVHYDTFSESEIKVPDNYSGHWRAWDDEGVLEYECDYENGELHGVYTSYYSEGDFDDKEIYARGKSRCRLAFLDGQRYKFFNYRFVKRKHISTQFMGSKEDPDYKVVEIYDDGTRRVVIDRKNGVSFKEMEHQGMYFYYDENIIEDIKDYGDGIREPIIIYDRDKKIDHREQHKDKILEFGDELKLFKKEFGKR